MSEALALNVQIVGISDWRNSFSELLTEAAGDALQVLPSRIPGTAGADREDQVVVKENTKAVRRNTVAAYLGAIMTAGTLIASQAGGDQDHNVVCVVQGPMAEETIPTSPEKPVTHEEIEGIIGRTGAPHTIRFQKAPK